MLPFQCLFEWEASFPAPGLNFWPSLKRSDVQGRRRHLLSWSTAQQLFSALRGIAAATFAPP